MLRLLLFIGLTYTSYFWVTTWHRHRLSNCGDVQEGRGCRSCFPTLENYAELRLHNQAGFRTLIKVCVYDVRFSTLKCKDLMLKFPCLWHYTFTFTMVWYTNRNHFILLTYCSASLEIFAFCNLNFTDLFKKNPFGPYDSTPRLYIFLSYYLH